MEDLQIKKLSCEFFIVMSFVKAINREVKKNRVWKKYSTWKSTRMET
jgi:hypothetical protein